ncbi:MAG: tetratricopeptide repeat protein [Planctomycetes bacterium]|nr:tetratricopeptide repeat protein [Planctomycetota bacterium]
MTAPSAETAYLFRHALLRAAAYELQPLGERAALHRLALELIPQVIDAKRLQAIAFDLSEHARMALLGSPEEPLHSQLLAREHQQLDIARAWFEWNSLMPDHLRVLDRLILHPLSGSVQKRKFMLDAARVVSRAGQLAQAEQRARFALHECREHADEQGETRALLLLEELLQNTGRTREMAIDLEALVANSAFDPDLHLHAMHRLKMQLERQGLEQQASEIMARSIKFARAQGLLPWVAYLMAAQANERHLAGDPQVAIDELWQAVEVARDSGDPFAEAQVLNTLGITCTEMGRISDAKPAYDEARRLAHAAGGKELEAAATSNLGNLHLYFTGELELAAECYRQAREFCLEAGHVSDLGRVSLRLSDLCLNLHEFDKALFYNTEALRCARTTHNSDFEAKLLLQRSRLEGAVATPDQLEAITSAMSFVPTLRTASHESEGWMRLADFLCRQGLLNACLEATEVLERRDAVDAPLTMHRWQAMGTAARALILSGNADLALEISQKLVDTGTSIPRSHFVTVALDVQLAALVLKHLGPAGLGAASRSAIADMEALARRMHSELEGSGFQRMPKVRAVLAAASDVTRMARLGPPAPLLMGVPLSMLTPQQQWTILEALKTGQPELWNDFEQGNPALLAAALARRAKPWLPRDTPLAQVPGVAPLLDRATGNVK